MDHREETELERALRLGRSEPQPEFVRELAGEVGRELRKRRTRVGAWRRGIAVGLTAMLVAGLAAVGAMGSMANSLGDVVSFSWGPRDTVQVVVDSPAQDEYQQPSLDVHNVVISSAAPGSSSVSGSFDILNASGGSITSVQIEWIQLAFESILPGGGSQTHTSTCTINPSPPTTIGPTDTQTFTFSCTISPAVPLNANELKVTVSAKAAGRDKIFSDTGGISF
jgi:hypothetical protein